MEKNDLKKLSEKDNMIQKLKNIGINSGDIYCNHINLLVSTYTTEQRKNITDLMLENNNNFSLNNHVVIIFY